MSKSRSRVEYGDFQTPAKLAIDVCRVLDQAGVAPATILEPTCGRGGFLLAAADVFPQARKMVGVEINEAYAYEAELALQQLATDVDFEIITADFFSFPWESFVARLPQPLLVLGNPPWVTNTQLASLDSGNVPMKSNFKQHRGIDAITGKGNFDIGEYMLMRAVEWLNHTSGTLAMLCKTAVARKVMTYVWKKRMGVGSANLYRIDSRTHFDAAVDAGLLVVRFDPDETVGQCQVHPDIRSSANTAFGIYQDRLVADIEAYTRWHHLKGGQRGLWRSGIKHDCAKAMQLVAEGSEYRNGLGEVVALEDKYLYPMLKSSDLAGRPSLDPRYWMLVTQQFVGQSTDSIRRDAPLTWQYLIDHGELLDRRASSIYRNRPRFSVFGVGDYAFAPWKVAVAGLYGTLRFRLVQPFKSRPVVLDDTCYFYACESESHAKIVLELLNSPAALEFLLSLTFQDDKRPVTVELLNCLDLVRLAKELDRLHDLPQSIATAQDPQQVLF